MTDQPTGFEIFWAIIVLIFILCGLVYYIVKWINWFDLKRKSRKAEGPHKSLEAKRKLFKDWD